MATDMDCTHLPFEAPLPLPSPAQVARYGEPGPRYACYPPPDSWAEPFGAAEAEAQLALADRSGAPLALDVRVPFCEQLCRFCSCDVVTTRDRALADRYLDGLERELSLWAEQLPSRRAYARLHLGGGTPTFLDLGQLERLQRLVDARFARQPDAELSLEINPTTVSADQLELLAELGYGRLGVGLPELDPRVQVAIGRHQTARTTERAMRAARAAGFRAVDLLLVHGLPHQTVPRLVKTLSRALEMRPDRVLLFGFQSAPLERTHQRAMPQPLPTPAERAALLVAASHLLADRGYLRASLDAFVLPGDALLSAGELAPLSDTPSGYSARGPLERVGVGLAALSELSTVCLQNERSLPAWQAALAEDRLPIARGAVRTAEDRARADAIAQVMYRDRLDALPLRARHGDAACAFLGPALESLLPLAQEGFVRLETEGLRVLPPGKLFLRRIAEAFDQFHFEGGRR